MESIQKQKYQAYAAATQTVARTKQIVMLYDGVIRFLQHAREAIQEKRIEDRYRMLTKASEVLMGLQGCLDFENGGNIAKILYSFYSTIDSRIFSIHRSNSIETCDEIIAELKKMREVWQEIDTSNSAGATPVPPPVDPQSSPGSDQGFTLSA
jgi:flagellar secretion chaperone FliS